MAHRRCRLEFEFPKTISPDKLQGFVKSLLFITLPVQVDVPHLIVFGRQHLLVRNTINDWENGADDFMAGDDVVECPLCRCYIHKTFKMKCIAYMKSSIILQHLVHQPHAFLGIREWY